MNDLKIYELIAKTPDIRAVQIADALDIELTEASADLRELVDIGSVVASKGFAPNGLQSQVYNLSEDFKASNDYKLIMGRLAHQPVDIPVLVQPGASVAIGPVSEISIAARGEAHIVKLGSVSDGDLREFLGLKTGQYPSSYLAAAIKAGRINKDGKNWMPGPSIGTRPAPSLRHESIGKPPVGAVARFDEKTAAEAIKTLNEAPRPLTPAPAPIPASTGSVFRCGLWSDGVLELQRDGEQVAALQRGEQEHLVDFMRRMMNVVAKPE